ncbi:MAG: protein phosphatase 2C domain-containing protein [Propionibacteriaceae bacterium]|jgi:protein phosphatase|nr:protein phosphatase 2C domain-containing protein [Propionibacteriaceae bacterium]
MTGPAFPQLQVAQGTHPGRRRRLNEDAVVASFPCFLVADGMGGHDRGERASAIVVEELGALAGRVDLGVEEVRDSLAQARRRIAQVAGRDQRHAPGTTVSGIVLVVLEGEPYWLVVNLGDSRTYRLSRGRLEQISVDHSEVQELLDGGRIDDDQARNYFRRHVVTRVLGAGIVEQPDYWLLPPEPEERWLICSDGLTGELPDQHLMAVLSDQPTPQGAVDVLLAAALEAGARDNVSLIVVDACQPSAADDLAPTVEEIAAAGAAGEVDDDTVPMPVTGRAP